MTLVIGIVWKEKLGDMVLMVSDSRVTTPFGIAYEMKKIYPITVDKEPVAVAGVAGDISIAKQAIEITHGVIVEHSKDSRSIDFDRFSLVVKEIERKLMSRFSELKKFGIDPEFSMLLGSLDLKGRGSLYRFDNRGLSEPLHDTPRYGIIGSGMVTGGILLLRLLGHDAEVELGLLTAFIIDAVSEVDTSVGPFIGDSYLMRLERNEGSGETYIALGPLKEEAIIEYKDRIRKRREQIKKFWRLLDELGEEAFDEMLKGKTNIGNIRRQK